VADLIAQGPQLQHRWRRTLAGEGTILLGRDAGAWSTPWDEQISRRHAELRWHGDRLEVRALPTARNPIFWLGRSVPHCFLLPGDHVVIGQTTFTLTDERACPSLDLPQPATEQTFRPEQLAQLRFRDADQRIDVLSRLPEIIAGAADDAELYVRLVSLLLGGIPTADAVALVRDVPGGTASSEMEVLHWDRRSLTGARFQPSTKLIRAAVASGNSVAHVWGPATAGAADPFTLDQQTDWAFCTPVRGDACRGWAIYVAGRGSPGVAAAGSDAWPVRDEVKFAELAATTLHSLRELRRLERRQASLAAFFSPPVLELLAAADPDQVLAPREAAVTVLFCDLRGFSRQSELAVGNLPGLLERVSRALGFLTRHILAEGGVVGDFHGDSAMGFWGWPLPQADAAGRACRAALAICREFARSRTDPHDPLADFRIGIGIATGQAVAGKIGTADQVKVTVFGPVVNLASRLEGMTKLIRGPVLLDQATADSVRQHVPASQARVRRVAVVQPLGMDNPLEVSQLLPPSGEDRLLTDEHLAAFENAVAAFRSGDWQRAVQWLHQVPAEDEVKDFLAVFIAQHNRTPPPGWNGVIPLSSK